MLDFWEKLCNNRYRKIKNMITTVAIAVGTAVCGFIGGILVGRRNQTLVSVAINDVKATVAAIDAKVVALAATVKAKV